MPVLIILCDQSCLHKIGGWGGEECRKKCSLFQIKRKLPRAAHPRPGSSYVVSGYIAEDWGGNPGPCFEKRKSGTDQLWWKGLRT
ncbi:hypothetical protein STEG23_008384, partial [Scotinomys teguina]